MPLVIPKIQHSRFINSTVLKALLISVMSLCFTGILPACGPTRAPVLNSGLSTAGDKESPLNDLKREKTTDDEEGDDDDDDQKDSPDKGRTKVNFGGAKIGTKSLQKKVADCVIEGTYYDRFKNGGCTPQKLAEVDCETDSLIPLMNDRAGADFEEIYGCQ